ncbi:MAG: exo-alpha-sialidase, partial [Verrucomicrobiae bacterium]|nr:exo-alpha-sialidase [Verrucomicrobiae bacterium]
MSNLLHVATRKGFFSLKREASGWEISKVDFPGQNATMSLHDPRDGTLYVALDHGHFGVKLHRSGDEGRTWEECGVPVFPKLTD